jgi:hypothetical protein
MREDSSDRDIVMESKENPSSEDEETINAVFQYFY